MFPIRDHNPSGKFPLATLTLILINCFVFFFEITHLDSTQFLKSYALIPSDVSVGNITTLLPFFTSMFLHGGWFHLLSNMWFLWIFGDNVEAEFGSIRYIAFYLVCGLVASSVQYIFSIDSSIPILGASGAIAGVLGSYLVFSPHARIENLVMFGFTISTIEVPASIMLGYWFITQLISSLYESSLRLQETGGIAFFAHIGGFIAGFVLTKLLKPVMKRYE